jgi:anti-sigma factor RsiW
MTDRIVSDEMLMAMADGEIDGDEAEAILRIAEIDPDVRRRLAEFKRTRQAARDAFAAVLNDPLPARLTAIQRVRRDDAVAWRGRMIVAVGVGYWVGRDGDAPASWALTLDEPLRAAIDSTPTGDNRTVETGGRSVPFKVLATYPVEGGACRVFTLGGSEPLRAVACKVADAWRLEVAAAEGRSGFAPASDGAVGSIEGWLDAAGAGDALSPEAEADLIGGGWPTRSN